MSSPTLAPGIHAYDGCDERGRFRAIKRGVVVIVLFRPHGDEAVAVQIKGQIHLAQNIKDARELASKHLQLSAEDRQTLEELLC